jgi:hypothetical protein
MRVETLTLTTASAAALTIGLASPALGASHTGAHAALHHRVQHVAVHTGARQALIPEGSHKLALVRRGGDGGGDGDGDGDRDGDLRQHHCDGDFCGGFRHRHRHCSGLHCGIGPFAFGDSGCEGEHCGDGDRVAADESEGGCCSEEEEKAKKEHARPMPMRMRPQVRAVPSGAVRSGFGGGQGMSVPLGVAGLSLILGGTGLIARRRIRTGARS